MNKTITHDTIVKLHRSLKKVRFMQFGHKAYHHCGKDVSRVRTEWASFQKDPVSYLATSPEVLSKDILTICE
jgi:hypothetical protein